MEGKGTQPMGYALEYDILPSGAELCRCRQMRRVNGDLEARCSGKIRSWQTHATEREGSRAVSTLHHPQAHPQCAQRFVRLVDALIQRTLRVQTG